MLLREITAASNRKFEKDARYLEKLFGTHLDIQACAVIISNKGVLNYREKFADPVKEQTLKIKSLTDTVLLYKHDIKYLPTMEVCDGVNVEDNFSLTKGYEVESYFFKPAVLPEYLENYIVQCMTKAFDNFQIKTNSFFERNFKRGGLMPLKDMKSHPEWQTRYVGDVDLKDVNFCTKCDRRALSGCCPQYSASNRIKVRMVVGWHQEGRRRHIAPDSF